MVTSPNSGNLRKSFSQQSNGVPLTNGSSGGPNSRNPGHPSQSQPPITSPGAPSKRPSMGKAASMSSVHNAINMEYHHNGHTSGEYDERERGLERARSPLERRPSQTVDQGMMPSTGASRRPSAVARDLSPARIHDTSSPPMMTSPSSGNRSRSPIPAVIPGGRQQLNNVTSPMRGQQQHVSSPPLEANSMFPPHSTSLPGRDRSPLGGGNRGTGVVQSSGNSGSRPAPMQRSYTSGAPTSNGVNFADERSHSNDQININSSQVWSIRSMYCLLVICCAVLL